MEIQPEGIVLNQQVLEDRSIIAALRKVVIHPRQTGDTSGAFQREQIVWNYLKANYEVSRAQIAAGISPTAFDESNGPLLPLFDRLNNPVTMIRADELAFCEQILRQASENEHTRESDRRQTLAAADVFVPLIEKWFAPVSAPIQAG